MDQEEVNLLQADCNKDDRISTRLTLDSYLIGAWHRSKSVLSYFLSHCRNLIGIACAFICASSYAIGDLSMYGGQIVANKWMVFVYNSTIGIALCFIVYAFQSPQSEPSCKRRAIVILVICGMVQTLGQLGAVYATMEIGPANTSALYNTMPIFTLLLNGCFGKKSLRKEHISFSILCVLGVALVSKPYIFAEERKRSKTQADVLIGLFLALFGAITHGSTLVIRQLTVKDNISSFHFTCSYLLQYSAIASALCTLQKGWMFPATIWDAIVLSASGFTAFVGSFAMYCASSIENSSTVAIILTSNVAMVFAGQTIIYDIPLEWMSLLGGFFICCACVGVALASLYYEK